VAEPFHTSLRVDNINCSRLMSGCVQPSCSPQHPSHLASSLSCRHDAMGRRKQPRSSSAAVAATGKSKEKQPGSSSAAVAETGNSKEKQRRRGSDGEVEGEAAEEQ
jgi:hypothetical protein